MVAKSGGGVSMSNFSVKLNPKRPCRYVFEASLWNGNANQFQLPVKVLLDTGSFNTVIHKSLVGNHGKMLKQTMMTSVGGFKGEANLCILDKIKIGAHTIENVVALAIPFEGELKDHILLGANVTNNWEFTLSRKRSTMEATEEFSEEAIARKFPYRYCYNNKGRVMALQEMDFELDN